MKAPMLKSEISAIIKALKKVKIQSTVKIKSVKITEGHEGKAAIIKFENETVILL